MLTPHRDRLAPFTVFLARMAAAVGLATGVMSVTLVIGVAGYHWRGGLTWIDSLLNASMILGGMGPVDRLDTTAAKLFASGYAIFCGLVLIGAMGIIVSPIIHRMLHRFHLDEQDLDPKDKS